MKTSRPALVLSGALALGLLGPAVAAPAPAAAAPSYVLQAQWKQTTLGPRLFVTPSAHGRTYAQSAPREAWRQARAKAPGRRLSASQWESMYDQFRCHARFAKQKPTWNEESWRRNVGYEAVLRAFCNP